MERIEYFDNIKGFAILLVIIGHLYLRNNPDSTVFSFLQCFHMPLFIFISGFFSYKNKTENFSSYIKKRTKSVLLPYFSFSLVYIFINGIESTYSFFCGFSRGGLWFLPTIYILNILGNLIFSHYKQSVIKSLLLVLIVEIIFISFRYLLSMELINFFLIRHISTYWLIYALGYYFNKYQIQITDRANFIITLIFMVLWGMTELYIDTNEVYRMIIRCTSTISIIYFFSKFQNQKINSVLGIIGKESLSIYIIHYSILMLSGTYLKNIFENSDLMQLILFTFLAFIITYICIIIKKTLCKNIYFKKLLFGEFKK